MASIHFTSTIEIYNGNPYVLISKSQAQVLKKDWKRPMPVLVQINGQPKPAWRINMMPLGDGSFYLYLHGDVRKASNTKVGDIVKVDVSFDEEYKRGPMHPMPDWFRVALEQNPTAKANWNALLPSRQKEILRYFSWLKTDDARTRNLDKAMHVLSGKHGRFMARSWTKGS
jgi:hypothetical protein